MTLRDLTAAIACFPADDMPDKTVVVVASCSRFQPAWAPFFTLFHKFWPDCPYQVIFVTDSDGGQCVPEFTGVVPLLTPTDMGWSSNMIWALRQIKADHILLFQEDFFIKQPVDTAAIKMLVRYVRDEDVGCLRLCACPGPSTPWKEKFLGVIGRDDSHRLSMQLAIWNRELFLGLLREGENPWELEKYGTERSKTLKQPFLGLWREGEDHPGGPINYIITGIVGRTWQKDALALFEKHGISTAHLGEKIP